MRAPRPTAGFPDLPHFPPTAKRVIYLFQSGGPSQMELFDYKPRLREFQGTDLPESVRNGQRLTGMSATQSSFPGGAFEVRVRAARPIRRMGQRTAAAHGEDRRPASRFVKIVNTEAINHDPAVTMLQTGFQLAGRPSMGSWVSYGLGCETEDLPAFVVMISQFRRRASRSTTACGAAAFCPASIRA